MRMTENMTSHVTHQTLSGPLSLASPDRSIQTREELLRGRGGHRGVAHGIRVNVNAELEIVRGAFTASGIRHRRSAV